MNTRFTAILATLLLASCSGVKEGPCDIYEAAGTPAVAAHSTTRILYSKYHGPLYQVVRASDGKTLDIGTVKGGYADAAAQDAFLEGTIGYITKIYDQSGHGNDLTQAAPGTFAGPAKGEFNALPIADMAPAVLNGHKVYGAYFMPGMGLRNNDAKYLAIDDEPEGIYYVIDGTHFDSGCCFDYGNSSTNGTAVGRGTMETTYFGTSTAWGRGNDEGPWIMADMEAGLFSGFNAKQNDVPAITDWRFVSVYVNGGGQNKWDLRGGDATLNEVVTYYEGVRPDTGNPDPKENYYPMHKKGGLLLANGGDNGNGSSGTFYEGVMTVGYPSYETVQAVQANIAAEKYQEQTMWQSRLTTFGHSGSHPLTVSFTNTTNKPISDLSLALELPQGWSSELMSMSGADAAIAPGQKAVAVYKVNAPASDSEGFAKAVATWGKGSEFNAQRIRSASPVKINELSLGKEQFIELYNNSDEAVSLAGWEIEVTRSGWAPLKSLRFPEGASIGPKEFLVLRPNEAAMAADKLAMTRIFIPVSTGPWLTIPAGSTVLPLTSVAGIEPGQKLGIDAGGNYEEVTVVSVGTAATQTVLAEACKAGDKVIKVEATVDLRPGMELTISTGQRKEVRKIKAILKDSPYPPARRMPGAPAHVPGEVELDEPLTIDQMERVDISALGEGVTVSPLKYAHTSGDAVEVLIPGEAAPAGLNAPAHTLSTDGATYGYTISPKAGAVALYHGSVLVDAVIYGSKQSNSSANGTICRPELAVLEGDQAQGGCLAEVPMNFWRSAGFRPADPIPQVFPAAQMRRPGFVMPKVPENISLVRIPDGRDNDAMCEILYTENITPGAANAE